MYAICPNCGETVEDHGRAQFIKCEDCGQTIHSRAFTKTRPPIDDEMDHFYRPSDASYPKGYDVKNDMNIRAGNRRVNRVSPIRSVFGFFCTLAVLFFIIVLLINFFAFFPAIAITSPNLIKQHEHVLDSKIPVIIDNTSPEILEIQNQTIVAVPGEQVEIYVDLFDQHLKGGYIELPYNDNSRSWLRFDQNNDMYTAVFQAPAKPGLYNPILTILDFAGNNIVQKLSLDVQIQNVQNLFLTDPISYSNINSSIDLEFDPWSEEISNISYRINNESNNYSLNENQSIPTSAWKTGLNKLTITLNSRSGEIHNQNFTIYMDNTEPEFEFLSIKSLTINRKDTFRNKVNKTTFYRGEFVKISTRIHESNLLKASVTIRNQTYLLEKVPLATSSNEISSVNDNVYQSIFSLPSKPGKFKLKFEAVDLAGNIRTDYYEIQIARINFDYISLPIIKLSSSLNTSLSLPITNSSTILKLDSKIGEIEEVNYLNSSESNVDTLYSEFKDPEDIQFKNLPDGDGFFSIRAKIKFQTWDHFFFTLPFPPYLFVLPIVVTGWYLLGFFIFIALAIILSNLYILKTSLSTAIEEIKRSLHKLHGPMIDTKNPIIKLAQLGPMIDTKNPIIKLAQLFFAVFSFSVIYNYILSLNKVQTHTPDFSSFSLWTLIYNLTTAAVYEEIISRILLIGVPLLIIHFVMKKAKKPIWKYFMGGDFKIGKLTILLILISSVTFGLAHAPGWDYWKVVPSFVSGLALGYLFVTHGVYASILLHFSINFLTIPLQMANYPIGPSILFGLLIFFWIFIGIIYFGYYLARILLWFKPNISGS
jgi:DNA-directed RNA polymerase subunit RPC12/RpoP